MKVLGVDPGAVRIGVAVVNGQELVDHQLLSSRRKGMKFMEAMNERIIYSQREFTKLLDVHKPDLVAIEIVPAFGKMAHREQVVATTVVLKTLTVMRGIKLVEYAPRSWHKIWCGNASCTKEEVKQKVVELYGVVPDMPFDVYDAIAIASVAEGKHK
jgi:crossover junction endodeoxyribonuclease RuvC